MSEETTPKLEPLTQEQFEALVSKLEKEEDYDSELAKATFTLLFLSKEYQDLYLTLQAYYSAATSACHDLAGACAQVIGLRDMKKIQRMYKLAGEHAGSIPVRAQSLIEQSVLEQETEDNTDEGETNE